MNGIDTDLNILIADDAPEHIQAAGSILKKLHYPIRIATSGRQALELARRQAPSLVLLDVSLGDMDGFLVCERIKELPSCQDTAVIFVTASQDEESIRRGFACGGQDYVIKPFLPSELLARAGTHLRLAARTRELKASYQELNQFCHTVSHDLKSPLMVIRQLTQTLVNSVPEENLDNIRIPARLLDQKCEQTIHMIERLLDFSRMAEMGCDLCLLDPTPLFQQIFSELSSLLPDRSIDFCLQSLPSIMADRTLLSLLIQNVLGNAIKFTKHTGHAQIQVSGVCTQTEVIITVADNGAGFDMQYQDRLFHVFERLHSASEFEGSGVGLAIVARIMKSHGGTASITGEPGLGCRISLHFPLADR